MDLILSLFQHGDENDAFKKVTSAITGNSALSLLVGTVGIQEWGDKNNFDLAEKHKVSTSSDWPVYMFFPAKSKKGVKYEQDKKSKDAILRFLREQKVPIRLAGRIDQLDALAKDFMANKDGRAEILKKAEAVEVGEKRTATKKLYLSIMQKIIDEGNSYVKSERKRLNNLLKEKDIKPEKKGQTEKRANILQAFADEATKSK